ncbi:hypothetical protein [Mucilaginibacter antarcticus]|uniref:hypothetical protein n=1 Tax=Mucilaginibacter antarcticus TaxID=1855725 RepID=UPI003644E3DA
MSHNMGSIRQLCTSAMLLNNGQLVAQGNVEETLGIYLKSNIHANGLLATYKHQGTLVNSIQFKEFSINGIKNQEAVFSPSDQLIVNLQYSCKQAVPKFRSSVNFYKDAVLVFTIQNKPWPAALAEGDYNESFVIEPNLLRPGNYTIGVGGHDGDPISAGHEWIYIDEAYSFYIASEWNDVNDFSAKGLINIPHKPL